MTVQGLPSRVQGQTWVYGLWTFNSRKAGFGATSNHGSLRGRLDPSKRQQRIHPSSRWARPRMTCSSSRGTPRKTRVDSSKWYYGFSEVRFRNERVESYDNYFGSLKIPPPAFPGARRYRLRKLFYDWISQDEVLVTQGLPQAFREIYGFISYRIFSFVKARSNMWSTRAETSGSYPLRTSGIGQMVPVSGMPQFNA